MTTEQPYVVNPEAIGDPNRTPVVALVREARNDLAAVVKERDQARAERDDLQQALAEANERVELAERMRMEQTRDANRSRAELERIKTELSDAAAECEPMTTDQLD
ncbi:MAG: hypothetical protein ACRDXB_21405, partial [Actinomycetes bacterium]